MTRPQRPCLDCGQATRNPGGRCRPCQQKTDRARNDRRRDVYPPSWWATSRRARKAQPWCTRCGATTDLTLDHETGTVQCRPCNSGHQGTTVPSKKGYDTTLDPKANRRETR